MVAMAQRHSEGAGDGGEPHIPVLLAPLLKACAPIEGHWVDATMGAGGFSRGLLEAGAAHVFAIDCDPYAHELAQDWRGDYAGRVSFFKGNFAEMEAAVGDKVCGVVFDLGVSSMQLDKGERGFSFRRDGPLDMRMSQSGQDAGGLVNTSSLDALAAILFQYGEERKARRIAKEIVKARPFTNTVALAECIAGCFPPMRSGQAHPATRSFQALRIATNDELGALLKGLEASERLLLAGGHLAVVSFHSLEDRIVKRFLSARAGRTRSNRHLPEKSAPEMAASFELVTHKAIKAGSAEIAHNVRARSARLRVARRTSAESSVQTNQGLGLPALAKGR